MNLLNLSEKKSRKDKSSYQKQCQTERKYERISQCRSTFVGYKDLSPEMLRVTA